MKYGNIWHVISLAIETIWLKYVTRFCTWNIFKHLLIKGLIIKSCIPLPTYFIKHKFIHINFFIVILNFISFNSCQNTGQFLSQTEPFPKCLNKNVKHAIWGHRSSPHSDSLCYPIRKIKHFRLSLSLFCLAIAQWSVFWTLCDI